MRVAILSDSHDNLPNLKRALSFIVKQKIKILLHCGDVCKPETVRELEKNFNGRIYIAMGNVDLGFYHQKLKKGRSKKTRIFEDFGKIRVNNLKIAFCHNPDLARRLSRTKKYDFVFYGHSHKPFLEKTNNCFLANPGNIEGTFYKSTFAILDTKEKKLELKILEKL